MLSGTFPIRPLINTEGTPIRKRYFVSLWGVRLLHQGQNFLYSTLPVCFFLFFVVL